MVLDLYLFVYFKILPNLYMKASQGNLKMWPL